VRAENFPVGTGRILSIEARGKGMYGWERCTSSPRHLGHQRRRHASCAYTTLARSRKVAANELRMPIGSAACAPNHPSKNEHHYLVAGVRHLRMPIGSAAYAQNRPSKNERHSLVAIVCHPKGALRVEVAIHPQAPFRDRC